MMVNHHSGKKTRKRSAYLTMELLRDILKFLGQRKKWWLAPIIFFLLFMGILLVLGGSSAVAPFIYSLF